RRVDLKSNYVGTDRLVDRKKDVVHRKLRGTQVRVQNKPVDSSRSGPLQRFPVVHAERGHATFNRRPEGRRRVLRRTLDRTLRSLSVSPLLWLLSGVLG